MASAEKIFTVRDEGEIYEVDIVSGLCSCKSSRMTCEHFKLIRNLLDKDLTAKFAATSSLHKELRRSDMGRSLMWLRWCIHMRGEARMKQYLRDICFEETRNFDLWEKIKPHGPRLSAREMTILFARSRKKWEIPAAVEVARIHNKATVDATIMPTITLEEVVKQEKDEFEFYRWFKLLFRVWCHQLGSDKDRYGNFTDKVAVDDMKMLCTRFTKIVRKQLEEVNHKGALKLCEWHDEQKYLQYNPASALIEVVCGLWDESGNDFSKAPVPKDIPDAELFPAYAFDHHTSSGKPKVRAALDKKPIPGPGTPLPVDLRWSGQLLGVWWRYQGFRDLGMPYREAAWEDVTLAPEEWEWAMSADRFWRKTGGLYRMWRGRAKAEAAG